MHPSHCFEYACPRGEVDVFDGFELVISLYREKVAERVAEYEEHRLALNSLEEAIERVCDRVLAVLELVVEVRPELPTGGTALRRFQLLHNVRRRLPKQLEAARHSEAAALHAARLAIFAVLQSLQSLFTARFCLLRF